MTLEKGVMAMIKKIVQLTVIKWIVIVSAFILVTTGLPNHFAWGMRATAGQENNETCLFSVQLREDPEIRKRYETLVIRAIDQFAPKVQSVDEMYADTTKASLEEDDGGFLTLFSKKNSHPIGGAKDIDNLTALCLGCHDGASAQDISVDVRNDPNRRSSRFVSASSDHPIGMDYNRYVASGKGYKLTTNAKMIFVNGKVGCLTCHDPFNQTKGHLVMSDRQGALCLTCHNK